MKCSWLLKTHKTLGEDGPGTLSVLAVRWRFPRYVDQGSEAKSMLSRPIVETWRRENAVISLAMRFIKELLHPGSLVVEHGTQLAPRHRDVLGTHEPGTITDFHAVTAGRQGKA